MFNKYLFGRRIKRILKWLRFITNFILKILSIWWVLKETVEEYKSCSNFFYSFYKKWLIWYTELIPGWDIWHDFLGYPYTYLFLMLFDFELIPYWNTSIDVLNSYSLGQNSKNKLNWCYFWYSFENYQRKMKFHKIIDS